MPVDELVKAGYVSVFHVCKGPDLFINKTNGGITLIWNVGTFL
jgi:hypothetical protein